MPWLDAAWHPAGWVEGPVPFDPSDRGLLLGDGVFDTALVLNGRMVWRDAHVARLEAACESLGFPVARTRLDAAIAAVLARCHEGSIRLTLTRGPGPRGLAPPAEPHPTVIAAGHAGKPAYWGALRLATAATRRNETSPLSKLKSLGYADAVLAQGQARAAGADEALFLNTRGNVASSAVANVFAVIESDLVTSPSSEGVLPGIARAALRGCARDLGLTPIERPLAPRELGGARAVWLTNSLRLLTVAIELDGQPLASDARLARDARAALASRVVAEAGLSAGDLLPSR